MANMCGFKMGVRGDPEDIRRFVDVLTQTGSIWMGRGAYLDSCAFEGRTAHISGQVKWSLRSALIDDAKSMRLQPDLWGDLPENGVFLTIFETCRKYNVNMEVYSEEPCCGFEEHLAYENGKELNDTVPYQEIWDEDTGEVLDFVGGYPSWDFSVADAAA